MSRCCPHPNSSSGAQAREGRFAKHTKRASIRTYFCPRHLVPLCSCCFFYYRPVVKLERPSVTLVGRSRVEFLVARLTLWVTSEETRAVASVIEQGGGTWATLSFECGRSRQDFGISARYQMPLVWAGAKRYFLLCCY